MSWPMEASADPLALYDLQPKDVVSLSASTFQFLDVRPSFGDPDIDRPNHEIRWITP